VIDEPLRRTELISGRFPIYKLTGYLG